MLCCAGWSGRWSSHPPLRSCCTAHTLLQQDGELSQPITVSLWRTKTFNFGCVNPMRKPVCLIMPIIPVIRGCSRFKWTFLRFLLLQYLCCLSTSQSSTDKLAFDVGLQDDKTGISHDFKDVFQCLVEHQKVLVFVDV